MNTKDMWFQQYCANSHIAYAKMNIVHKEFEPIWMHDNFLKINEHYWQ